MKINRYLGFNMITYNTTLNNDLQRIYEENLNWNEFSGKNVLITGATGLIASYLTSFFIYLKQEKGINVAIYALCRTKEKALSIFGSAIASGDVEFLYQDVCQPIPFHQYDYIFHLAGNASPYFIKKDPVGIIKANVEGTLNVLELAKKCNAKVFFASTREVYGKVNGLSILSETDFGEIDCMDSRSCYPESKRLAETMLHSFYIQHNVQVYIARIAHTYGPGMSTLNDGRIMSDLLGNALRKENILLKSKGDALRAFCYVSDTVSAFMFILLKGKTGEAYNLSNEREEICIKDLAELIATLSKTKVQYDIKDNTGAYCNYQRVGLDTSKIEGLGWEPKVKLCDGIVYTLNIL
jgi:nucleoside-diphosphate-sugar epimerase